MIRSTWSVRPKCSPSPHQSCPALRSRAHRRPPAAHRSGAQLRRRGRSTMSPSMLNTPSTTISFRRHSTAAAWLQDRPDRVAESHGVARGSRHHRRRSRDPACRCRRCRRVHERGNDARLVWNPLRNERRLFAVSFASRSSMRSWSSVLPFRKRLPVHACRTWRSLLVPPLQPAVWLKPDNYSSYHHAALP